MINTNITSFRKNLFSLIDQAIRFSEPVNISTKEGNAVLLSEDDYNALMETLYISSFPALKNRIIEGMQTPISECVSEDEVDW